MDKIFLLDMFKILLDFLSKKQFITVVNSFCTKDSIIFKDIEYNTFEGKKVIKGRYFKDILRFLYLNKDNKNFKKLLNDNKFSFKKILSNCEDYKRVTSYNKNFKDLLLFLSNCGFFIKNPYKFNTSNTFEKIISYDLYHSNKGIHLIYSFNVFDYRLDNNKSDSNNTTILYLPIGLYNSFIKWNKQQNDIIIKDKNSFYLNYNDKKLLNQIRAFKKPQFNKERFIEEVEAYESRLAINWEKEQLESDYYHNIAFEYMEYNIDIDIDIKKESYIAFDINKYPVIKAYYENGCIKYSHKPNGLLIKSQYKKELIKSKKINKNFKKSLLINYDSFYNRGFIQDMDL